ncbi:MAG: H-type small acid-soluble spore protein [Vallitalea sp.]|jgi:H-type small acid-soluble spore protein|nr:H-type small acid-soluble spore protein [Vallitalea sp.]
MTAERVQEILDSKGVIDVDYDGKSVWIKNIDKVNNTVEIEIIEEDLSHNEVVSINELYENI